tara:strand:+ start:2148 stop:2798 length:651 start_codon:yes stop_codon:yes gene_type:complete
MAWKYQTFAFIHNEKCGGTWVSELFKSSGLEFTHIGAKHAHAGMLRLDNLYAVTFVRHPLDWYRSYWAFRNGNNWKPFEEKSLWHPTWQVDRLCASSDFNDYIEKCLKLQPRLLTHLYSLYTGCNSPHKNKSVDFVGKLENLRTDLVTAIVLSGIDPKEKLIQKIKTFPPKNQSNHERKNLALYDRKLMLSLAASERRIMETFGYTLEEAEQWAKS